jgi:hypothetical protein
LFMLIFQGYNRWWIYYNFLFSFKTKSSREYIKGVFLSIRITRLCSKLFNSVAIILGASRRAIKRFFKTCYKGRPLKPTLYLYIIMLLIKTKRLPRYSTKKTAYILYINRDREFVKEGSKLLNILNSGV